ncbi:MAG: hypothetical protein ABIR54_23035 [Burkholderiaceae bacterium]|jgi:hypothetical protein
MSPRMMTILWPSFLMAGVLEGAVFSVVDPAELRWMGQIAIDASPSTVYSLSFLAFWGIISTSGALTALLWIDPEAMEIEPPGD